jgi:transcriptional regulator with XRE-family HTH domain
MKNFLDLDKRLRQIREYLCFTQAEIASESGINQKEISLMESGGRKTLVDQYIIYLHNRGVNLNWLYFGIEPMLISNIPGGHVGQKRLAIASDPSIPTILHKGQSGDSERSTKSKNAFQERISISPPGGWQGAEDFSPIKVINQNAASAYVEYYQDETFWANLPEARLPFLHSSSALYVMVQVSDEAMLPVIHHGDWIVARLISDPADIREGYVHLIVTRNGIFAKQVLNRIEERNALALKSFNYQYHPTYNEDISNILQIWRAEYYISASFSNPAEDIHKRLNRLETELSTMKTQRNFHI